MAGRFCVIYARARVINPFMYGCAFISQADNVERSVTVNAQQRSRFCDRQDLLAVRPIYDCRTAKETEEEREGAFIDLIILSTVT